MPTPETPGPEKEMEMNESGVRRGRRSTWYFLLLVLVNLMWAFQYTGARIATRKLGPFTVTLLPMAMAALLLGILLFSRRGRERKEVLKERGSFGWQLLNFAILGLVGCFLAQFCLTFGVKLSLASNASVITLSIPVMTAVLATLLLGEKMSRLLWVSFALAILGVLLVSDVDWHTVHIFRGKYLAGNAVILVACFGSAFYNAFSKRMLRTFTPLEVLVYSYMVAIVALFTAMLVREPLSWRQLASLGFAVWLSLGMIAFLCLTSAMLLFFWVIKRIDLTQASLSFYLLPVFGVLISTITLKEKIRWQLLAGGILVFLGAFLATKYGDRERAGDPSVSGGNERSAGL
jgi:drug/metabolite transporter (DMT)-like permease